MAELGVRVIVRGRVQGVGYRVFALRVAQQLGVRGYARNLHDGSVEVVATGDAAQLAALQAHLTQGPPGSRVEAVESARLDPMPHFERFDIRHGTS
jgi:acylphosphatase